MSAALLACSAPDVTTIPSGSLDDDDVTPMACGEEALELTAEDLCEDDGDYEACYRAAVPYFTCAGLHSVRHRGSMLRGEALAGAEIACGADSVDACRLLGMTYATGLLRVERDFDRASEALQRGCDLGDANQCTMAGSIPWLVPREPTASDVYWLRQGCRLGDADGCDLLEAACREGYSSAC